MTPKEEAIDGQIKEPVKSDPLQKTQEEMDREKVEEIMSLHFFSKIDEKHREAYPSILLEAINYGRKTKQD